MQRTSIALSILLTACAAHSSGGDASRRGTLYSPTQHGAVAAWSKDEQQQPLVIRNLRRTPEASFHLMRVRSEVGGRAHTGSDLVLVTLAGKLVVTLADREFTVAAGDVLEIPRGAAYAIRNVGEHAGVAYLVFTPALAPDDTKAAPLESAKDSVWRWNLWLQ